MSAKRCPRDGLPIALTPRLPPRYCLRGSACGVSLCPLSWPANAPPREVVKALSAAANAERKRATKAGRSEWRKRREKIARRRQYAAAREAKRAAARSVLLDAPPERVPQDRRMRLTGLDLVAMALAGRAR